MIILAKDTSGGAVVAYNERNQIAFSIPGKLVGFTGSTVSIRESSAICTYNEQGRRIASVPA